jgi:MFS family permease
MFLFRKTVDADVLPALSVRREHLRQSMRTVTVAWMFGCVWGAAIQGSQMTYFCWMLGFSDRDFGTMTAIASGAALMQLVSSMFVERSGERKYHFIYTCTAHRVMWLLIALVPMVIHPGPAAVLAFFVVYSINGVLAHMSGPPWQTWMGDLIPRRIRGRYFASRSRWTIPIHVCVVLTCGLLLDWAKAKPITVPVPRLAPILPPMLDGFSAVAASLAATAGNLAAPIMMTVPAPMTAAAQPHLLWLICGIFLVAACFGITDIMLFFRMREIAKPLPEPRPTPVDLSPLERIGSALIEPLRPMFSALGDAHFRRYALYAMTLAFSTSIGGQYFWTNCLDNIKFAPLWANFVFLVCGSAVAYVTAGFWGRMVDRWGSRPVLMFCTAGVVLGPLWWFLVPVDNMAVAYLVAVLICASGGNMWNGIGLAQTNIVLGFSESRGRSKYVAAWAVAVAAGGVLGGLAGGQVATWFKGLCIQWWHFRWVNYHVTFLIAAVARAAAILWLRGVPDTPNRTVAGLVRYMWHNTYANAAALANLPARVFGRKHP